MRASGRGRPWPGAAAFGVAVAGVIAALWTPSIAAGQAEDDEDAVTAVRAERVLPVSGPPIENGIVLVRGSKIEAVGREIPIPEGAKVIDLGGATVMPGIIDARATYGLTGGGNEEHSEITPEILSADAIDLFHPAFQRAVRAGVTAAYIPPGTRNVISGRASVVKTAGRSRWVSDRVCIQGALGSDPSVGNRSPRGMRPRNFYYRRPNNRMGVTSVIRRALFDARNTDTLPELLKALRGEFPIRMTARRASDVTSALQISSDYHFPLILDDAGEAYPLAKEIAEAGVPVVLRVNVNPHDRSPTEGGDVAVNAAALLHKAGVRLALATWADPGRAGPQDAAALAHRFGLPGEVAIRAITSEAAEITGVSDRIGTLEEGKDADLVAFDGDPLQVTSSVTLVMIDGRVEFRAPASEAGRAPPAEATPADAPTPDPSMNERQTPEEMDR